MDKLDRLSLSVVANDYIFSGLEWKIHSEHGGKEWKNNIHRVLFPTQISQFWDTATFKYNFWSKSTHTTSKITTKIKPFTGNGLQLKVVEKHYS